ncbi:hypothetical protein EOL73_04490 [Candidatus Saccharibacteria bacterium]|nr:hypothetical protein [Candidatus Saccharibacteria bacterium]
MDVDVAFEAEFFGGPQDGMVRALRKKVVPGGNMEPPLLIYFAMLAAGEVERWAKEGADFDKDSLVTTVKHIYRKGDMPWKKDIVPYEYVGVEGENEQKCVF